MILYLALALFCIFLAFFIIAFNIFSSIPPSADYGHKLPLSEKIKNVFAIHHQIMKIKFLNRRLTDMWIRLGKPNYPLPEDMLIIKLIFFVLTFAISWVLGVTYGAFPFGCVAFFLPDWYFSNKAFLRLREIERNFPAALDLMTLCVEAGIDFMSALVKIIEHSDPNPLIDEFQEIIRELQLGSDRKQAMKNFASRCDLEIVSAFVSVVVQAEELGTSLAGVLRDYSGEMKIKRLQSAEKQAMEAPVKMLIPMMIFIFPGVFILIFGPIGIKLMEMFL